MARLLPTAKINHRRDVPLARVDPWDALLALIAITGLPILLTGAALVGLPILLHLIMKQEPKRLPFPAFRFLKIQRQVNQRKIRLRHLILLLMRMALIALICLSLWQPTILSEGFSLRGDRPIVAVFIVDTSPSMGYVLSERKGLTEARKRGLGLLNENTDGPWTCLDEARGRIMEILDELPPGSKIAIVDTADRGEPFWAANLKQAQQQVRDLKKPKANSFPVTRALESSYALLAKADAELEPGQEPFPRLLMVLSDRTAPSWDNSRTEELTALRDRVPQPSIFHVYIDVGVDKPVNNAITAVDFQPQLMPANQPFLANVVVEAVGNGEDNLLIFSVDGEEVQKLAIKPTIDRPITRQLRKDGLKPGLHQGKVSLLTSDALTSDNERHFTFRVREPRHVLTLVDPPQNLLVGGLGAPSAGQADAFVWKNALDAFKWYACDVQNVDAGMRLDWSKYELITLFGVPRPTEALWTKLATYVQQGGHLLVVPGGPEMDVSAYRTDAATKVLPRRYTRWADVPRERAAVTWTWNALNPARPILTEFRKLKEANSFFDDSPPLTRGFWQVDPGPKTRVIVDYNDSNEPDTRSPALLESGLGPRGKVIQFTVPLGADSDRFHNYAAAWLFYLMLANEAVKSLVGDSEEQIFNFTNGQNVLLKWPAGDVKPTTEYYLSGPDVQPNDAIHRRESGQAYYRFGPEKSSSAGNFTLEASDRSWRDGFSLNASPEESRLERLPTDSIEAIFGKDSIAPASKELKLNEILIGKFTQPIELFPFLMILLLLIMAVENLLANKFYRKRKVNA